MTIIGALGEGKSEKPRSGLTSFHGVPHARQGAEAILAELSHECETVMSVAQRRMRGKPDMFPREIGIAAWSIVSRLNPNHGGLHAHAAVRTTAKGSLWAPFRAHEVEAIGWIAGLLGRDPASVSGYVTSGATEGNLAGLWSARNRLRATRPLEREGDGPDVVLLLARTAHYSLLKAADILGFDSYRDSVNKCGGTLLLDRVDLDENYRIDLPDLRRIVEFWAKRGCANFIVVPTIGSTVSGAIDLVPQISYTMAELSSKLDFRSAIHVDAAFGGLVAPFSLDPDIRATMNWGCLPNVSSYTLDFHKMGGLPYGCGIFVSEGHGFDGISRPAEYTASQTDATILGSRSGAMASALWATIRHLGWSGFAGEARASLCCTKGLAGKLLELDTFGIKLYHGGLNQLSLVLDPTHPNCPALRALLELEGILGEKIQRNASDRPQYLYPLYIMPDLDPGVTELFITRIQEVCGSNPCK